MRDLVNKIVKNVVTSVLNEGEFKMGDSIVIPGNVATGRKIIRAKYGLNPDDFEYVGSGKFVYKVKPKKTSDQALGTVSVSDDGYDAYDT